MNKYRIRLEYTDRTSCQQVSVLEYDTFEEMKEQYDRLLFQTLSLMKNGGLYVPYESIYGYSIIDGKRKVYKSWWIGKKI